MSVDNRIRSLNDPDISTNDLLTTLNTLHSQKSFTNNQSIQLCSILLNKIIPQTFKLLNNQSQNVIYDLLSNRIGISQLIRLINNEKNTVNIKILLNIISKNIPLLLDDLCNSTKVDLDLTWKSLLTHKIYESLGSILVYLFDHTLEDIDRDYVKSIMDVYPRNIISNLLHLQANDHDQLNAIRYIIVYFLNKRDDNLLLIVFENWNKCIELFTQPKELHAKQKFQLTELQNKFLIGLFNQMNLNVNNESSIYYIQLIKSLLNKIKSSSYKESILKSCQDNDNVIVNFIWMKSIGAVKLNYIEDLMNKFGNKEYISNTTTNVQSNMTRFLILLLSTLNNGQLNQLSCNKLFLDTITNRLESKVPMFREFGMYVADYIYTRINGEPMFKISSYEANKKDFMKLINELNQQSQIESFISDEELINEIQNTKQIEKIEQTIVEKQPIMIEMNYESDNDDSDLDDPTVSRNPTIAKPVFLKDLLHYLTTDPQNDKTTYEKRSIAFSIGIEMIRIKKNTPELKYYATKLIDAAMDLDSVGFPIKENEQFNDDDIKIAFDSWKLSFLIAICTCEPDIVFDYFLTNFIKQDWAIPLRVQILSCIGLSCRELCGRDDDFIWGKKNLDKVKPKELTGLALESFTKLEKMNSRKIVDLDQLEKENKLVKALENTVISEGTVIHRSRKLDIDKAQSIKSTNTTFINKKLPRVFFSMIAIWQEVNVHTYGNGFAIGSMSEYLNSHYLDILSMVYSCSIPSCISIIEMTIEEISVLIGQLRNIQTTSYSEFPSLLFNSIINSLRLLIFDNAKTLNVIKSSNNLELTALLESYAQVLSQSPPLDEPLNTLSKAVLEQLQQYSFLYS